MMAKADEFGTLPRVRELREHNIELEKQISGLYIQIEQLTADLRCNDYELEDLRDVFEGNV